MKILLVASTEKEIQYCIERFTQEATQKTFFEYQWHQHLIIPLVTGIGSTVTAFALARYRGIEDIDLALHVGIAGAFDTIKYPIGSVVEVVRDRFADLGVEDSDGTFHDVHDIGLVDKNLFPLSEGWIDSDDKYRSTLPHVVGLTVNKVTGCQSSIDDLCKKYNGAIETMESAAFLYAMRIMDVDHLSIRGISNQIEPRNRGAWRVDDAIKASNDWVVQYLKSLQ